MRATRSRPARCTSCSGSRREVVDEDTIRLTDRADGASILVDTPLGLGPVPVGLSRQPFLAPADEDVNRWLSDRVGTRVRLVWQEDPTSRPISGAHGGRPGDVMNLADAGPVLLVSEASMAQLNAWIRGGVRCTGSRRTSTRPTSATPPPRR